MEEIRIEDTKIKDKKTIDIDSSKEKTQKSEIDVSVLPMINDNNRRLHEEEEFYETYTKVHEVNKPVKKVSKRPRSKKMNKVVFKSLMGVSVVALLGSSVIASRISIGKNNISYEMMHSEALKWFDDHYYMDAYGMHELSSHVRVADYGSVIDPLTVRLLNEGWSIDEIAIKLEYSYGIHPDVCGELLKKSSFKGRTMTAWNAALISNRKELDSMEVEGVSK